jgi:hypothetical protein
VTSTQPPISLSEIAQMFPSTPVQEILMPQMEPTDTVEELCAYHSYLDKLNDMFSPDPRIQHWTPDTIYLIMCNTFMMMRKDECT